VEINRTRLLDVPKKTLIERFEEKVDRSGDCWTWTSAISPNGYGVFWVGGGRSRYAHRMAWEFANPGFAIPKGMVVMHSCDRRNCVNPSHLRIGTQRDNVLDAKQKGRNAYGERNGGGVKLNELQVRGILQSSGVIGCVRAARMYGVSSQTIKRIRRGKNWRHINLETRCG